MIKPSDKDMNRSGDVKGPELKRGDDKMPKVSGSGYNDVQVLAKHSLSDLHDGDHHAPLTALGKQSVVESSPMGSDSPDHKPNLAKGGLKDQSRSGGHGMRESMPKGMGRSVAKKMMYAEKEKDKY